MKVEHDFTEPENHVICPSLPLECRMAFAGDSGNELSSIPEPVTGPLLPARYHLRAQLSTAFSLQTASHSKTRAIM